MLNGALQSRITRRGLLIAGGTVVAARLIRSRASSVSPLEMPANRDFGGSPLITSPAALLTDLAKSQVLDASDLADYHDEHITGARHVCCQDLMDVNALWYGLVLKAEDESGTQSRRIRFLERLGISSTLPVIIYDRGDGLAAARVCWFLNFLGLQASLLDGGLRGWIGLKGPTSDGSATVLESVAPTVVPKQGYYLFA